MRPVRGAVTIDLLLWVAGTLIAIVFFIGIVWPWLLSIWYGSCWADARTDLRGLGSEMEGAIRNPNSPPIEYRLTIGDCIAGVVFVNGLDSPDAPPGVNKLLEDKCSEYDGFKSYMLLIPREVPLTLSSDDVPASLKDKIKKLGDSISVWEKIKLYLEEKMGKKPPSYCYELEHDFSSSEGTIKSIPTGFWDGWLEKENWNTGAEPYCLEVSPVEISGGGFNYYIKQVPCPAVKKEE